MRHYTCDICGMQMPESYERAQKRKDAIAQLCCVDDVCVQCSKIGGRIPVRAVLLAKWKELAGTPFSCPDEKEETPAELLREKDHPACFAGRGGAEKGKIHARLMAFRGNPPRLGCWNELSAATGGKVSSDELRQIVVDGMSPTIEVWRTIGKALDKLEHSEQEKTDDQT